MGFVSLDDLFHGLGQAQPAKPSPPAPPRPPSKIPKPPEGGWSPLAKALQDPLGKSDWTALGTQAASLALMATAATAIPVAKAAGQVQAAAHAAASGGSATAKGDPASAVDAAVSAAQLEDEATSDDRAVSQDLIGLQIFQLNQDIAEWKTKNSNLGLALWDKIRGSAKTEDLDAEADQIQTAVDTTPLTSLGRSMLNAELVSARKAILAGSQISWETIGWAALIAAGVPLAWWLASKAQAAAVSHVKKHAARTALGRRLGLTEEEEKEIAKEEREIDAGK